MKTWLMILAGMISLCACAHPPERNAVVMRAETATQRAVQAHAKGDLSAAKAGFTTALRLYESLADSEGRARSMLSLAKVMAQSGHAKEALNQVEALLADPAPLSPALRVTAHGRAAGLALTIGDAGAAQRHLDQAVLHCAEPCGDRAALVVLGARIRLAQGKADDALALLDKGIAASESGNAQRVRAQALSTLARHREAAEAAASSLQHDQTLGRSDLVIIDLDLLAQAHAALGEMEIASRYQSMADRARAARRDLFGGDPHP